MIRLNLLLKDHIMGDPDQGHLSHGFHALITPSLHDELVGLLLILFLFLALGILCFLAFTLALCLLEFFFTKSIFVPRRCALPRCWCIIRVLGGRF